MDGDYYVGSDGKRHYVDSQAKNMQDKTPNEVRCTKCLKVVVSLSEARRFAVQDPSQIEKRVESHMQTCKG